MAELSNRKWYSGMITQEDWWAVWAGLILFFVGFSGIITNIPKPTSWTINPLNSFGLDSFISYLLLTFILYLNTCLSYIIIKLQ